MGRTPRANSRRLRLNDLNPYSFDANGFCEPTGSRAEAYERDGPPADPRADVQNDSGRSTVESHLRELKKVSPKSVNVQRATSCNRSSRC
jgi:hypothetical protein